MSFFRFATVATTVGVLAVSFAPQSAEAFTVNRNLRDENSSLFDFFNARVNQERLEIADSALTLLDPSTLFWDGVDPVDVFFINEGAGYRNQLFASVNGGSNTLLFNDVSSTESILPEGDGPLRLGDGGTLGAFTGPTQLSFFIKADGYNGGTNVYGADPAANPDGLQHVMAYQYFDAATGDNWVVLGFEDLFGVHYDEGGYSDRDFNDVVFAVRGLQGRPATAKTPESSAVMGLIAVGMLAGATRLRSALG